MVYTGKTALITGASSGIGAEYAREFAARGSNVVLVARRRDRLDALAKEITGQHGVSTIVVDLDLTRRDAVEDLVRHLAGKDITVDYLINNAGFGVNDYFVRENRARTQDEIRLNVAVLVDLTAAYLPGMLERDEGAIINIASTASFQPVPGMAVYGATKAFVRSFTEALWGETQGSRVRILAVNPGATESEFFEVAGGRKSPRPAPASDVIRATFRQLDSGRSGPSVIVGGSNRFAAGLVTLMPRRFVIRTVGKMFLPKS